MTTLTVLDDPHANKPEATHKDHLHAVRALYTQRDAFDRLRSIAHDVKFVDDVRAHYPDLPVVSNARCGLWYAPPLPDLTPAYFKSTSCHPPTYTFPLRRPNLHLLPLISFRSGIILVDSTRRGKALPDSFSRTVPIWCAVLNRAYGFPPPADSPDWLYAPPTVVSPQEHAHIASLLPSFVHSLLSSALRLPPLSHPLRPLWIHPSSSTFPVLPTPEERTFFPVICVCASRVGKEETGQWTYVQGAGDDHDAWAQGLTPEMYWANKAAIDGCEADDLEALIERLVRSAPAVSARPPDRIAYITPQIFLGTLPLPSSPPEPELRILLLCSPAPTPTSAPAHDQHTITLHLPPSPTSKKTHLVLLSRLPSVLPTIPAALADGKAVVIASEPGAEELGIILCLVILQTFVSDYGDLRRSVLPPSPSFLPSSSEKEEEGEEPSHEPEEDVPPSKASLARRVQWIVQSCQGRVDPSRATLKRVNEWFMSGEYREGRGAGA